MNELVVATGSAFVEAKLAERDARHERMGDSRYVLEPHIKEGKGGLRDLQTLFWIAKYLYRVKDIGDLVERGVFTPADCRQFRQAQNFLWTVRCHLHYVASRPEERLTFNFQDVIARRLGYADRAGARGVERFMKHYFRVDQGRRRSDPRAVCRPRGRASKARTRFRLPSLPMSLFRRAPAGFRIDGNRLAVDLADAFDKDPVDLLRLFHEAQRSGLDIHPQALRLVQQNLRLIDAGVRENPEANRLFLEMLTDERDPEPTLKRLNDAGVFGRFVPDFGRVVAQMQYDMYHVYTVDEHTIRAIGILSRIERGALKDDHPAATAAFTRSARAARFISRCCCTTSPRAAAATIRRSVPRWRSRWAPASASTSGRRRRFPGSSATTCCMSRYAFKRDIDDPKTVTDFTGLVQSPERLRMLMILTNADIRAVGPNIWNAWKAALLRRALLPRPRGDGDDRRPAGGAPRGSGRAGEGGLRARLADWPESLRETYIGARLFGLLAGLRSTSRTRHHASDARGRAAGA